MADAALERFYALWGEVADLKSAAALLGWDQETQMPSGGGAARGKVQATLAGLRHAKLSSPELSDTLDAVAEGADPGDQIRAAQVREARRVIDRVRKTPESLARRKAEAETIGHEAWTKARRAKDFTLFEPALEELIALGREEAKCLAGAGGRPYDALLDLYEPGATEAQLEPLFSDLRESLSTLVQSVRESGVEIDESPARGSFPPDKQREFGLHVARAMGFDFEAGRLDLAPHPFCQGLSPKDVRLTWRFHEDDFRSALFGIMHEAGHGLYEQGLPLDWERTPLGEAVSLGIHESQSRLWENLVGRSQAFWEWALPHFHEAFPGSRGVQLEELIPALHTVKPSLIRVEADQGTYDLHIAVRFDLERRLFQDELQVSDLPGAWDEAYEAALGIRAPHVSDGVLQDIHWSMGAFGYFPTYTLGNLISAQLFRAAEAELGDLAPRFAAGEFGPLLGWLRENVHAHGRNYSASELVERATGRALSADDYLASRRASVAAIYGV